MKIFSLLLMAAIVTSLLLFATLAFQYLMSVGLFPMAVILCLGLLLLVGYLGKKKVK